MGKKALIDGVHPGNAVNPLFECAAVRDNGYRDGLIAEVIIRAGRVERIDFTPLDLDEGETYRLDYGDVEFLSRRGLAQVATGPVADSILFRLRDLSARYGAELTIANGRAALDIGADR